MRAVVALICISCLASSARDFAELSDVLRAEDDVILLDVTGAASYSKIPFYALKHNAIRVPKAKTASDCQQVCSQRTACKSFSFSVRKRDCWWSKTALSFNGHFSFFSKRTNPGKKAAGSKRMSRYREFVGLMYQSRDFTRYQGKSQHSCQDMCDRAKDSWGRTCKGFSYRIQDQTCLLSPFGVHYDTDYDYFERKPAPKTVKKAKKTKLSKKGKLAVVVKKMMKKKKVPPLDVKFKPKKKAPNMTSQYKTELAVQKAAAKFGKKELAHKLHTGKKTHSEQKKTVLKIKVLAKKQAARKKADKIKKKKAKQETLAEERKRKKAEVEKTRKVFLLVQQKQKESTRKKSHESKKKLRITQSKMREKGKKELKYKTIKRKFALKLKKQKERRGKKVDGLIKQGIQLAAAERRNKKRGEFEQEHATKERLVKLQVAHVKGRRHARHKHQFEKFAARTLARNLRKRKTSVAVSIALKQTMKQRKEDLAAANARVKKLRALVHLIALTIAKQKAKANGLQHAINLSAKQGKKAPRQEVKLQYTMNAMRAEQRKEAFKKQKLAKQERDVNEKKLAVKRLDNRMTAKGVGRRRRASKARRATKKKKPSQVPKINMKVKKSNVSARRRRTKARLTSRFTQDAERNNGVGKSLLPGVPATPTRMN